MTRTEEYRYQQRAFTNVPLHKIYTNNNGYVMALFHSKYCFEKYCLDFSNIENFEKAKADNFKGWHCHHRLEEFCTRTELIEAGLYFNRKPSELIFLKNTEHSALHIKYSLERHLPIAKNHTWKPSKDFCEGVSKRVKESIWVTNGTNNKRVKPTEIPSGYVIGRTKHGHSSLKGRKWVLDNEGKRKWVKGE